VSLRTGRTIYGRCSGNSPLEDDVQKYKLNSIINTSTEINLRLSSALPYSALKHRRETWRLNKNPKHEENRNFPNDSSNGCAIVQVN
jgi:hypothetical protein